MAAPEVHDVHRRIKPTIGTIPETQINLIDGEK